LPQEHPIQYFLGANTAEGFYSLYDDFADVENGDYIYYIKGGPGNGKSTFMRKISRAAEEKGMGVEYAMCSGDPASLDGIYIREIKTAFVDATSPHVQEPALPGAAGRYIDLSAYYRRGASWERDTLARLFSLYREQYAEAYRLFQAAGLSLPESIPGLVEEAAVRQTVRQAREAAARYIPNGDGFKEKRRFYCANTCDGPVAFWDSIREMGKVCLVSDACGLADVFLKTVAEHSKAAEQEIIRCPDPLRPKKLWGLLLPEAGLAFVTEKKETPYPDKPWRRFRLERLIASEALGANRDEIRRRKAAADSLLRLGQAHLRAAKDYHDRLEALYFPAVDFRALDAFTKKTIQLLHLAP